MTSDGYGQRSQASRRGKSSKRKNRTYAKQARDAGGPKLCDTCATPSSLTYTRAKRYDGKPIWLCTEHAPKPKPKAEPKIEAVLETKPTLNAKQRRTLARMSSPTTKGNNGRLSANT